MNPLLASPTALRRLAWVTFAACVVMTLGGIAVGASIPREAVAKSGWGASGALADLLFPLMTLTFPLAGILIARRLPHNRIAWLLLAVSLVWSFGIAAEAYERYGLIAHPGSLPSPDVMAALGEAIWVPGLGLVGTYLILLFPDGRLPSPRWRIVAWASGISIVLLTVAITFSPGPLGESAIPLQNPLGIEALAPFLAGLTFSLPAFPVCILACAAALVVRFRRSRGVERLQLKWLATAGAAVAFVYLVTMAATLADDFGFIGSSSSAGLEALQSTASLSFGLLPVAIGVAVLKHGLYGIDVVINKALVFGALGAFITGVYVAIVVGVGTLVGQGNNSLALSITATAVVAIGFQPVRERVQRVANRLVYGQRATPYEVLSDFANRMGGAYGSAELLPKMARTVADGMGAERVDVWLNIDAALVREASWPTSDAAVAPPVPTPGDDLPALPGDRVVPVRHHGELLGAITVTKKPGEPVTPTEDKLLADVAAQAGLVLRNVRLIEELRGSRERLVKTQDTERRRLERNLHDGAQQSLVSVAVILRIAQRRVGEDPDGISPALDQAAEQLATAIDELRELARGIHPALLTERGLGPALSSLAQRSRIPTAVTVDLDAERLSPTIEGTVYFFAAEALANITKHAHASAVTINVSITPTNTNAELTATVTDDGIGGADPTNGSGLSGLADRIAAVDGHLDIHSPPGAGTRLICRIPVTRDAPAHSQEPGLTLPRPQPAQGSPSSTPAHAGTR